MAQRKVGKQNQSINLLCKHGRLATISSFFSIDVHKRDRWYNIPSSKIENSTATATPIPTNVQGSNDQEDSIPLDFDTFIPSYNPSFGPPSHSPAPGPDYVSHFLPPGPLVDEDEAFTRALGAMYWGGYWTAVYHVNDHFYAEEPYQSYLAVPKIYCRQTTQG